jgi:hypothetical protein
MKQIQESNFLEEVTGTSLCCVHFYHHEFERCRYCPAVTRFKP